MSNAITATVNNVATVAAVPAKAGSVAINDVLNNNVVLKDIQVNTPFIKAASLDELEQMRVEWEEGVYRTSNLALYNLLARCLQYGAEAKTTADAKARSETIAKFYKARGYRYKKDTPLMSRIVRAVFGDIDRRRVSTYSLVLRQAQTEKVSPEQLCNWIEERGGVQEIRLCRSSTFVSPKQRADIAKQSFETRDVLAVVRNETLSLLADAEYAGDNCVLLAEQQADGSFAIRALLRQDGVVNAAFTALYAQQKAVSDAEKKEREAANEADGQPLAA